jgi:hypothetical protein
MFYGESVFEGEEKKKRIDLSLNVGNIAKAFDVIIVL